MNSIIRLIAALVGFCFFSTSTNAGEAGFIRPKSYLAMRWEATVPQHLDFTCGAASLATILTFFWSQPTTEAKAFDVLKGRYSAAEIRRKGEMGLSFDDLIFIAEGLGFHAQGGKVSSVELRNLNGPVIVHLDKKTFQHFVVLRSVGDGVYYVSDPIVGQLAMAADEFEAQYSGHSLAVWKDAELPSGTSLLNPRDGITARGILSRIINERVLPFHAGF